MRAQDTPLPIETILGSFARRCRDTELVSTSREPVVTRATHVLPLASGSFHRVETSSDDRARLDDT